MIRVISRETGEPRGWVGDHADPHTCAPLIAENLPAGRPGLSPDAWQRDRGSHPSHATVRPGGHAWARDDAGDGRREVHGNPCEGAGAGLRTDLRAFRGVHTQYLPLDVATYEAMVHTTRVTPERIRRMCVHNLSTYSNDT